MRDYLEPIAWALMAMLALGVVVNYLLHWGLRPTPPTREDTNAIAVTSFGLVALGTHFFDVHSALVLGPIALCYGVALLARCRSKLRQGR